MKEFFKTFLKMKYNRLLSFIYIKDFRRLYRPSAQRTAPQHTAPRSTTASARFTSSRKNKCQQEPRRKGNTKKEKN